MRIALSALALAALTVAALTVAALALLAGWCGPGAWSWAAEPAPGAPPAARLSDAQLPAAVDRPVDFARDVEPILRTRCHSCHGPEEQESGLRLDDGRRALLGGDRGPAIVPGKSAASPLVHAVAGGNDDLGRMPPADSGAPLTGEQVAVLRGWIDQGARWPAGEAAGAPRPRHWSLQPIVRPPLPAVVNAAWPRNAIDVFLLARLEGEGLAPAPEADRATLLRRVHFDLIGLPPTPEEAAAFERDDTPDAYERLVDRLLASPHYAERWGRFWLDLARYADSDGYEKDRPRPHAWRYRQWVLEALNRDVPYDEFSVLQLAGDLLPGAGPWEKIATGFHRNTLHNEEGGIDREEDRVKKTVDRTNTLGSVWLGLTVGCAQCHTHKYDRITQREYFGLYGLLNDMQEVNLPLSQPTDAPPSDTKPSDTKQADAKPAEVAVAAVVSELSSPRPNRLHLRGDFLQPGPPVPPGTPEVLPPLVPRGERPDRLDLARWLFSPEHPLTARVAVNYVWQQHFGRGLVATSDDFGTQGDLPSHPELLDWLASDFRDQGLSLKRLHRAIVTSAAYRQSAAARGELAARDPYNALLARQNRLRLEAETIRDAALAASGLLDPRVGGPSVRPPQPGEYAKLTYANSARWEVSPGGDAYRRGLYTFYQRTSPYPMLATFDAPDASQCATRRVPSNTPLQALTLWNDPVFVDCARTLGARVARLETPTAADDDARLAQRLQAAWRFALARDPTPREIAVLADMWRTTRAEFGADLPAAARLAGKPNPAPNVAADELAAWILTARTLMNLDEFITRP